MSTPSQFLDFALHLAHRAEATILPYFNNHTVSFKSDGSEVTIADKEGERVMRELITQTFPNHSILGEEFGEQTATSTHSAPGSSSYRWVLDPIDGTAWFTLGVPLFGTLVALLEDNEPIVGVIHLPGIGETVYAAKGMGCWFQSRRTVSEEVSAPDPIRVKVRSPVTIEEAIASTTGLHSTEITHNPGEIPYRMPDLIRQVRKFRFCSDCNQHALVARGKLHVAVDTLMNPWDVAALVPCVEEAGGTVTNLAGERDNIVFGGSLITSCGDPLHSEVIQILTPDPAS
ncbi:MAG: inositol monophosphatase family protein [Merismopedia sp. SIO2A8]|nr:inositol monophosphatase family protein [Merismopedia sp. SIO2A8]